VVAGNYVHWYPPFKVMAAGLGIWCIAVCISGVAKPMQSFGVLIFGRALSGVGEASFQCIAPAFIQDYAPQGQQVLYLGIFFSSITVGTAGRITSTASFMHPPGLPTPNQKPQQQQFRRLCVQCHHLDL